LRLQVNLAKVKLEILKPWISQRITQLLGLEDDIVIGLVFNVLEDKVGSGSFFLP
jgi:serine/arginine repetitive matrix protein 1